MPLYFYCTCAEKLKCQLDLVWIERDEGFGGLTALRAVLDALARVNGDAKSLVFGGVVDGVDDDDFDRAFGGDEFDPEGFFKGGGE